MSSSTLTTALQQAIGLHNSGRLPEAAALYQDLLISYPDHPEILAGLGTIFLQLNHPEQGVMLLERSLALAAGQANVLSNLGIGLSSLNRLDEALASYDKAIALNRNFAQAYNNRGLTLHQLQQYEEAVISYDKAIAITADFAEAYYNRGNAQLSLKQFAAALLSYDKSIDLKPDCAGYHNNRGNALKELNRPDAAIASYETAIALKPDYADAYKNLGKVLKDTNRFEDALAAYQQVITLRPHDAEAYNNQGVVLLEMQQTAEASASFQQAIHLNQHYADAYFNLGNALREMQQFENALACFEKAVEIQPDFANAYCNHGNLLQEMKKSEPALSSFDKALAIATDFADAYNNRGNALKDLNRPAEAVASYDQAIALKPGFAEAYYNRGQALFALEQYQAASASYDTAIALDPDFTQAYWNNSLLKLLLGEYEAGWKLYEWRWKNPAILQRYGLLAQDFWNGTQSLAGKTLLINREQGFGDFIQFCRYIPILQTQAAQIIVEVPAELYQLASSISSEVSIFESGQTLPKFDFCCPLMSMPLAFKTTLDSIPASVPYLYSDTEKQRIWHERLGAQTLPRVGLAWSGAKGHSNDINRSMPLNMLEPLFQLPIEFHVLQKQILEEDENFLRQHANISMHQQQLSDFSETAALIKEMDLVISVDTAVAHLAGALAKPVWILLPYAPDFRWMLARSDSPWYPTACLLRQAQAGNWSEVVSALSEKLQDFTRTISPSLL